MRTVLVLPQPLRERAADPMELALIRYAEVLIGQLGDNPTAAQMDRIERLLWRDAFRETQDE